MRGDDNPELAGTRGFLGDDSTDESFEELMREEEEAVAHLQHADAAGSPQPSSSARAAASAELHTPPRPRQPQTPPWDVAQPAGGTGQSPGGGGGMVELQLPNAGSRFPLEDDTLIPSASDGRRSGSLAARNSATKSLMKQSDGNAASSPASRHSSRRGAHGKRHRGGGHGDWEPTILGTVLAGAAGTALALAWFLTSAVLQAPAAPVCTVYKPAACLLQHDTSQQFQPPACQPRKCAFNSAKALACPFAANGTFVRQKKEEPGATCSSPFLDGSRRRMMPPCSKACCDGDLPGHFQPLTDGPPGAQQWQPRPWKPSGSRNSTSSRKQRCSYFQYNGAEVLHYLQGNRVRILVLGDSLMRQLHARLVHMFRGTPQPIDHRIGGMARYAVCRAGDSFTIFEKSFRKQTLKPEPPETLQPMVQHFSGKLPQAPGCDNSMGGTRDHPVAIDYIHSTRFKWQEDVLRVYQPEVQEGERLIVIIAVNAAERQREVSVRWMQYLDSIRKEAKIIVVGSPTAGIAEDDTAAVLAYRNKLLQSWAASVDAISYVDFDAMSNDAHRPPPAAADLHWMCWLRWPRSGRRGKGEMSQQRGANVLREPSEGVPVIGLHTTEDGACQDEMNRNLWQVLFNVFMKHRWS